MNYQIAAVQGGLGFIVDYDEGGEWPSVRFGVDSADNSHIWLTIN